MKPIAVTLTIAFTFIRCLQAQIPDFTPQTPLIGALLHNETAEAKRLLETGADPNQGRFVGFPPVFLAIMRQDAALVKLMAAKGAALDFRDRSGSTALMWAASNENGSADLVEELLRLGADPLAVNKTGDSALTWASRHGETPATETLRKAGLSNAAAMKDSVQRALSLLQKSGSQFIRVSGCYSCHHQSVPQMAIGSARTRGIVIDEEAAKLQDEAVLASLRSVAEAAVKNPDRIPDPPIGVSYALIGLGAANYPANETTSALAKVVAAWQADKGAFFTLPAIRPPMEASHFTSTALSLRALQLYGDGDAQSRIARANKWLRDATPQTNEDRVMQLLGLAWGKVPQTDLATYRNALLAQQREDGGWSQLRGLETDAYATGQALVALYEAGQPVQSAEYQRGIAFLLRTQYADGSWLVRTRTHVVQIPKDSGFPHGKHQWISAAGTGWAAMAIALAMPPQRSQS